MNIQDIIFSSDLSFEQKAHQVWEYQYNQNPTLRKYCDLLQTDSLTFMPVSFFKDFEVKTGKWKEEAIFESSGTTGQIPSRHYIKDLALYKKLSIEGFNHFFPEKKYKILALLPSYLERENASLVKMVTDWIETFGSPGSGFYLRNFEEMEKAILESEGEDLLLIGVAFALLDFSEFLSVSLPKSAIVMETGGMKGRKEELIRQDLHERLCRNSGIDTIISEYGMTELMSQAYAMREGRFRTPPWMKVIITDVHLPDKVTPFGQAGRINIIDLGNVHSCAFIATDDVGIAYEEGSFEVLGRIENSELRGCSLMYV